MSVQDAHLLMDQIGPHLELTEVSKFEDDCWTLVFDDDVAVIATFDGDWDSVTLSAEVGEPPAEGRAALCELMLSYGNLWRETGGVRLALTEPGGPVVQLFAFPVGGLTKHGLGEVLTGFVGTLRAWREAVARGVAPAAEEASDFDPEAAGAIRI